MYRLAEALHKFVWEVEDLPVSEIDGWIEYYEIKAAEQRKEEAARRSKSRSQGSKGTFG